MINKPNEDLNHDKPTGEVRQIPLDSIIPNRYQPRKTIEKESLQELIDSISTHGILQPIVVRQDPKSKDKYEIIMGERRFRSCQALRNWILATRSFSCPPSWIHSDSAVASGWEGSSSRATSSSIQENDWRSPAPFPSQ